MNDCPAAARLSDRTRLIGRLPSACRSCQARRRCDGETFPHEIQLVSSAVALPVAIDCAWPVPRHCCAPPVNSGTSPTFPHHGCPPAGPLCSCLSVRGWSALKSLQFKGFEAARDCLAKCLYSKEIFNGARLTRRMATIKVVHSVELWGEVALSASSVGWGRWTSRGT